MTSPYVLVSYLTEVSRRHSSSSAAATAAKTMIDADSVTLSSGSRTLYIGGLGNDHPLANIDDYTPATPSPSCVCDASSTMNTIFEQQIIPPSNFQTLPMVTPTILDSTMVHNELETTKLLYLVLAAAVALTALTAVAVAVVAAVMISRSRRKSKCPHCYCDERFQHIEDGATGQYYLQRTGHQHPEQLQLIRFSEHCSNKKKVQSDAEDDDEDSGPAQESYCWDSLGETGELTLLKNISFTPPPKQRQVVLSGAAPTFIAQLAEDETKSKRSSKTNSRRSSSDSKRMPVTEPTQRRRLHSNEEESSPTDSSNVTATIRRPTKLQKNHTSATIQRRAASIHAAASSTQIAVHQADGKTQQQSAFSTTTLNRFHHHQNDCCAGDSSVYSASGGRQSVCSTFKPQTSLSTTLYTTNVPSAML